MFIIFLLFEGVFYVPKNVYFHIKLLFEDESLEEWSLLNLLGVTFCKQTPLNTIKFTACIMRNMFMQLSLSFN